MKRSFRAWATIAALGVRAAAPAAPDAVGVAAGPLLSNGSFEAGAGGAADGWSFPAHWRVEDGAGMNGTRGVAFENADDSGFDKFPVSPVPFAEGARYEYSAWVRTRDLVGGTANLCMEWKDADGKWMNGSYQTGPTGTSDWTLLRGVTPPMPLTARSVHVAIYVGKGALGRAWFDDVSVRPASRPFFGGVFSSAYRDTAAEGKVEFRAAAKLADHPGAKVVFTYVARDGEPRGVAARVAPDVAFLEIDVSDLALGTHPVRCDVFGADGSALGGGSLDFTRVAQLPPRRVWIDGRRRAIVDGSPFFPLGMYMGGLDEKTFGDFLSGPFNCVMPYREPDVAQLDMCLANGVSVIYPLNSIWSWHKYRPKGVDSDEAAQDRVERVVAERRDHPAILAWYCNDEIPLERLPRLLERQRLLERIDPGHPTWTVLYQYGDIRDYYRTFDIVGADPYPVPASPIGNAALWTRTADAEVMGLKPLWMVPQAFAWEDFGKDGGRFPTREEMLNMTWQCVANGATGLVYFTFRTLYRDGVFLQDRWEDVCAAAGSVRPFVPVILSDEEPPSVTGATDDLSARAWRHQGDVYLAAVNNTRDPVRGEIGLDVPVAAVETLMGAAGGCELSTPRTVRFSLDGLGVAVLRASVSSDAAHLRAIHADGRRNRGHD